MKICLISGMLPPYGGGAELVVAMLARDYTRSGAEVQLLTTAGEEAGAIKVSHHNIFGAEELGSHGIFLRLLWHIIHIFNRKTAKDVRVILEKEKPDLVHTHNLTGFGFLIPRMIRSLGIPHTHTLHDVQLINPSGVVAWNHKKDSLGERLYSSVTRRLFGSPTTITTPSRFLSNFYQSRGFFPKSKFLHLPNPSMFAPKKCEPKQKGKTRFLFVGSLTKHKGCDFLLSLWQACPKDLSATLTIVGSGPLQKKVERLIAHDPRVVFLGPLYGALLEQAYAAADVLLFPSLCIENSPLVVQEAFAYGLSVLAAQTGGVPELFKDEKSGKLLEPGNTKDWVQAITQRTYSYTQA